MQEETIAAIATPEGKGGIGIIRVSGPQAEEICNALFRPKKGSVSLETHRLYHGEIVSPETGTVLDEVLAVLMKSPRSYTGENTLEIHCHGGPLILRNVLGEVVKAGARPAGPGEFTKRAFLNNRLDLSQAEAVMELIEAQTARGLELALSHLRGDLSAKTRSLRASLIEILAHLEKSIDFGEEDAELLNTKGLTEKIGHVIDDIRNILSTYGEGKIHREGVTAVITGKPNVGKSSLLNRLLGEKRVIVTKTPGTTRDFIEETVSIQGLPVKFVDTAGIRESREEIESEGIALVWEKAESADVVIILLDGSEDITKEDREIIDRNRGRNIALVVNKSDLPQKITTLSLRTAIPDTEPLWISAKYGEGIPEMKEKIHSLVFHEREGKIPDIIVTDLRHKTALERALENLLAAREGISEEVSPELPSLEIREALDYLGEILGETTNEEVLDKIFSRFCIGK
ncbi:MAG: tRNA uridine-5-carboxymethylaminomethyl(34) synthesis GTPase MnmE [Thermodesulfobacteriota bacterium]|nr:tRNA uridine-5-carboxymethylaminomethyl(34) synthesis GTPase MnmE [Thermodesulfobacteriota bacterium]